MVATNGRAVTVFGGTGVAVVLIANGYSIFSKLGNRLESYRLRGIKILPLQQRVYVTLFGAAMCLRSPMVGKARL
jgi:hypothetical protein